MVSFHGLIFKKIETFWSNLRTFFYRHKTLFDVIFLLFYTLEQLTLFILILVMPEISHIFAGIFAILFIATISFEKICMESRYRFLENNNLDITFERENIIEQYNKMAYDNERLMLALESALRRKK